MNLRKESRAANLKKWKAQGPAIIQRPAKLIAALLDGKDIKGDRIVHPDTALAYNLAMNGDGARVNAIARATLKERT